MDIKSMLVKLAEEQADKMQEEAMKHLASDEMAETIATKINEYIMIIDLSIFRHYIIHVYIIH